MQLHLVRYQHHLWQPNAAVSKRVRRSRKLWQRDDGWWNKHLTKQFLSTVATYGGLQKHWSGHTSRLYKSAFGLVLGRIKSESTFRAFKDLDLNRHEEAKSGAGQWRVETAKGGKNSMFVIWHWIWRCKDDV